MTRAESRMPIIEIHLDWVPEVNEIFPDGAPDGWTSADVIRLVGEEVRSKGLHGWIADWGLSSLLDVYVGGVRVSS